MLGYTHLQFHMWRLSFRFFLGIVAAAIFTNAVAVYLLHGVDADRSWDHCEDTSVFFRAYREEADRKFRGRFLVRLHAVEPVCCATRILLDSRKRLIQHD
jgi:hypothetical protein